MRSFVKILGLLGLAFITGFFGAGFTVSRLNAEASSQHDEAGVIRQLVELTNVERDTRGLPPLKLQNNLGEAAIWLARDMAEKSYLSHTDSQQRDVADRSEAFGYEKAQTLAENVAAGAATAAKVLAEWMKSDEHRANILNPALREIGVGYAVTKGRRVEPYWVQDFGTRVGIYPIVINQEGARTSDTAVELYIYGCESGGTGRPATRACPSQMRLSNNGMTWTAWERYTSTRTWTLSPGTGIRQVMVELRGAGSTYRAKDTIELGAPDSPTAATRSRLLALISKRSL